MDGDDIYEAASPGPTRIFVGGLGGSVTGDDLGKLFSSAGTVKGVDIVRTKGRSFAYLDLLPSSPKSLTKLISTYNGCIWKGGRLKLEKAKEHYLIRLRREWAENVEFAGTAPSDAIDAEKNTASDNKPKKVPNPDMAQLRIFFPRLRKVKSLPISGTGKHKYSFQRIEVPPLPTHFCDCEEHSVLCHTGKDEHFFDVETHSVMMDKEEINMMVSVMNKFLEGENVLKAASNGARLIDKEGNSIKSIDDDLVMDETESDGDDNLIINVVTKGNNRMEANSANQELIFKEFQTLKDAATQKGEKMKILLSNKKRKLPLSEESDKDKSKAPSRGPESGNKNSTISHSWSQKASWKQLVADKGSSSFSISHILSDNASEKEEQPGSQNMVTVEKRNISSSRKKRKFLPDSAIGNSQDVLPDNSAAKEEQQPKFDGLNMLLADEAIGNSPDVLPDNVVTKEEQEPESDGLNVPDSTDSKNEDDLKPGKLEGESEGSLQMGSTGVLLDNAKGKSPFSISNALADNAATVESEGIAEAESNKFKLSRGAAWVQKSSWIQLVSENTEFRLSQVLPDVLKANSTMDVGNSTDIKDGSKPSNRVIDTAPSSSSMVVLDKEKQDMNGLDDVEQSSLEISKDYLVPKKKGPEIGESCSFMRSAASMKEWGKTKAALSGSIKKKEKGK